jgi:hypothetical protein
LDEKKIGHAHFIALIRFFYHIEPETLTADSFAKLQSELIFLGNIGVLNIKINAGN